MKTNYLFLTCFSAVSCLFADSHHPSLSTGYNLLEKEKPSVSASHQSSFMLTDDSAVIFQGNIRQTMNHWVHADLGLGARKFFGDAGVGCNLFGFVSDKPKFFAYQISPGLEFFWDWFRFGMNYYIPTVMHKVVKDREYEFHKVMEFNLSWEPNDTFKMAIKPTFNLQKQTVIYNTYISYVFKNQLEFLLAPHYDSKKNKGLSLSITFHFNKPPRGIKQLIDKEHRFFYETKKFVPKVSVETIKVVIPKDTPPEVLPVSPTGGSSWWPFFFLDTASLSDFAESFDFEDFDAVDLVGALDINNGYGDLSTYTISPGGSSMDLSLSRSDSVGSLSGEWDD